MNKPTKIRKWIALATPWMLLPGLAAAASGYDRAQVVGVNPIYETVRFEVPVEACRDEQVAYTSEPRRRSATAPILGAIIGGALGNAVGHNKSNRKVGTVVGAVLGGSIGADIGRQHRRDPQTVRYRTEQVCDTRYEVREEEQLAAYDVRYVYGGTTYSTRMNRHPGDSIRVRVRVTPAE